MDSFPPGRSWLMDEFLATLLANPVLLAPVLLLVATLVFAVLKRLLKLAAVLAIAGVLYVLLAETVGSGGL